ncbi:MAG TPA: 1,4-alpha-glucan branching enzyme, partial [Mycobacteriales bacterium]|nr:1,4-alpha-glucan branching enzyme [Mycobacteriales bacterium]
MPPPRGPAGGSSGPATAGLDAADVTRLLTGSHHDPHGPLGARVLTEGVVLRVLRPGATEVHAVVDGVVHPLSRLHPDGLFGALLPGLQAIPDYRLRIRYDDQVFDSDDPYRFLPTLGALDLHLISEGRHERLWDVLGAHVRSYPAGGTSVTGTSFAVWAPNARGVR